jgi:hypothetical protein
MRRRQKRPNQVYRGVYAFEDLPFIRRRQDSCQEACIVLAHIFRIAAGRGAEMLMGPSGIVLMFTFSFSKAEGNGR